MKKKIGIITFHSAHNYGAVLQVYALKEFLKNRGNEVCVVNYRPKEIDRVYKFVKPTKRTIKGRIKYCIKYGKVCYLIEKCIINIINLKSFLVFYMCIWIYVKFLDTFFENFFIF